MKKYQWLYELDRLKILGKTYTVVYEENPYFEPDVQPDVKNGMCDHTEQRIHLYSGQTEERMLETLIHESIHAICDEMVIELEEEAVSRLGAGIQALIMDNFELTKNGGKL